jgi:succinate dehydrogenase / fumarate reductase membrane anchor subunit
MQSQLGRVRGLGSAKSGSDHWWSQRLTAIANVPLGLWFVLSIATGNGASYEAVQAWLSNYFHATMMVLFVANVAYHFTLGLQVVIEDYIHDRKQEIAALLAVRGFAFFMAVASIISVLRVVFAGA